MTVLSLLIDALLSLIVFFLLEWMNVPQKIATLAGIIVFLLLVTKFIVLPLA